VVFGLRVAERWIFLWKGECFCWWGGVYDRGWFWNLQFGDFGKGRCMRDINWVLCLVKKGLGEGRISWHCCGFVIMSRGRWGKCG